MERFSRKFLGAELVQKEGLGKESAEGKRAAAKAKLPITYQTRGHGAGRERRQGPREAGAKEIR